MQNLERVVVVAMFIHAACVASSILPAQLAAQRESTREIAFLEHRVETDPGDLIAQNRLGSLYLERLTRGLAAISTQDGATSGV